MVKTIAFDLGNVLLNIDWDSFFKEMPVQKDTLFGYMDEIYRIDFCGHLLLSEQIAKKFDLDQEEVKNAWNKLITPNDQMVNFVKSLKSEGYKIAYLSNIGFDHLNHLRDQYSDFLNLCDVPHMSCEVGAAKPSNIFYQSFLLDNEEFCGSPFIDDLEENLSKARRYKFKTYRLNIDDYKKPLDLKKELNSIRSRFNL